MKVKWEIAKSVCTDDRNHLYRWGKPSVQMVKSVRTDGFHHFTHRILRHLVADFTGTGCGFTHYRLRFYS